MDMTSNATVAPLQFDQPGFDALLQRCGEPDWLQQDRREAWQTFCRLNWPQRNEEQWMRTDIRMFKLERYQLAAPTAVDASSCRTLLDEGLDLGGQIVTVNSRPVRAVLEPSWAERGVLFGSLAEFAAADGERLQPYLTRHLVDPSVDKFAALHKAFWSGGTLLYVPRGLVVDQPLHLASLIEGGGVDLSRLLVILEEGAEATLLCETSSTEPEGDGLHCGGIEMFVHRGANLRFVTLQDWGRRTWHFAHQKASLQQDASLQWTVAALGGRLAKVNQTVELVGPGANCEVNGVMFTEGKQQLSYNTLQHHVASNCRSDFLYKGALQDQSYTVWRGMIQVDPGAQKTDGYQRNDNLLLSPDVRADSIPGLEIEADDVRCSHGSTTGRVDDELLFYAQSRGFTRKEAIRAIVAGFFQQIFDRVTISSVRNSLAKAIARRVREYE